MNVGIRYPEGRIGRPREIGGRHVRKEREGRREGGPEGLRCVSSIVFEPNVHIFLSSLRTASEHPF